MSDLELYPGFEQLKTGLEELDLVFLDNKQIALLLRYVELFQKWCKAYNLSAIRDLEGIISLHLLDSLAIAKYIEGERFIDVGTGAGLPGVPLAIVYPKKEFVLLDSAGKKIRFLVQLKQELALTNIDPIDSRVEQFRPALPFDGVLSRAYSSLDKMIKSCAHLVGDTGCFWPMKGQFPVEEIEQMDDRYSVIENYDIKVPGLDAQRSLLKIRAN